MSLNNRYPFDKNGRGKKITKSVRIETIITKTTILLENYGIFNATDSKSWEKVKKKKLFDEHD